MLNIWQQHNNTNEDSGNSTTPDSDYYHLKEKRLFLTKILYIYKEKIVIEKQTCLVALACAPRRNPTTSSSFQFCHVSFGRPRPSFQKSLDTIEVLTGDPQSPFRMPIIDKFKDMMGTVVVGKVESGTIREGNSLLIMPNKDHVKVVAIYIDKNRVKWAGPGENPRVQLSGVEPKDILSGFVLSSVANPISAFTDFVAKLQILELPDNAIFSAGYKAVLHIHSVVEECEIVELLQQIDPMTEKPMTNKVLFINNGAIVLCRVQVNNMICVEKFSDFPPLGRITLCTEGKTVAVGIVTAVSL